MEFEWDALKAKENLIKHKVSFSEAAETFADPDGFALRDEKHSKTEQRYFWIGMSSSGKIITTRYTRRRTYIRIIGAAEWRDFRRLYYEKAKAKKS